MVVCVGACTLVSSVLKTKGTVFNVEIIDTLNVDIIT